MLKNNTRVVATGFIVTCPRSVTTPLTLTLDFICRRNRIIASLTKGVTAQNATTREKKAPQCAMRFNGLNCITGAGGGKTTTWWKKRRDKVTIAPD
jgi:hypothetical protein